MNDEILITTRLCECNKAMISLFGDKYEQKIEPFKNIIKTCMKEHNENEIKATIRLSKIDDGDASHAMLLSALFELPK